MADIPLRKVISNWPPATGAGFDESPPAEPTDVIKRASVSREGHLVLNLSRNEKKFTAADGIAADHLDAVRGMVPRLAGKTIATAGEMSVYPDQ